MLISPYARLMVTKKTVNCARFNRELKRRKIRRIYDYSRVVRLVKEFHSHPVLVQE